jgi:hypothetical protein
MVIVAGIKRLLAGIVRSTPQFCWTVNVRPAILTVPLREPPEFALTVNATVPLPVPFAPAVTTIHVTSLTAVQEQWACVDTATVPLPPAAANV